MGLDLHYIDGQTPLDEDEKNGLRIKSIATCSDLDEFEQLNIEEALAWTLGKKWTADYILSETFIKELHKRMFKNVWAWAGDFRRSDKNIGVAWHQVGISIKQLIDDSRYWLEHGVFVAEEFAIRFKHRIVQVHCFSNGNGRHSRLMADVIVSQLFGKPAFTWGSADLSNGNDTRTDYLRALKQADNGNITPLISFART